jgi:hypothetical protein
MGTFHRVSLGGRWWRIGPAPDSASGVAPGPAPAALGANDNSAGPATVTEE